MKKIIFSLVLFRHSLNDIIPLLNSISELNNLLSQDKVYEVVLSIYDNTDISIRFKRDDFKFLNFKFRYIHNPRNIGFGRANNFNFKNFSYCKDDIYIASNPDTFFDAFKMNQIINYFEINKSIVCANPVIKNYNNQIQFTAKKNPTLLSLFIGLFPIFLKISFLRKYDHNHKNKDLNYLNDTISSSYLSGCFLLIKADVFKKVSGFSQEYFLHLEDADFVRKCSKFGLTVHIPLLEIRHLWNRGSHKSFFQIMHVIRSMFIYFSKWGFKLY